MTICKVAAVVAIVGGVPSTGGEGRDAFHVDVTRKIFHCFSCGAGGDVLDLVAVLNQCTLREAALQLKDWFRGAATGGEQPTRAAHEATG